MISDHLAIIGVVGRVCTNYLFCRVCLCRVLSFVDPVNVIIVLLCVFFFNQKTAYEI